MLKISDFSRIAQVSPRTLRYYDNLGLLKPREIDPGSGYRYYAVEQLARLNRILALKDLGFGLDQIASLLDANITPNQMREYLRQQEREIEQRMREDAERLSRVRDRLQQIEHEDDPILIDVIIKSADEQLAIGNRMVVPTAPDLMFFCNHMLVELYQWLRQHRIPYTRAQYVLYHTEEYVDHDLDTEVAVVLPALPDPMPRLPHGGMRLFRLPAAPILLTTVYHGPLQQATPTVRDLVRWGEQEGYTAPRDHAMMRELHLLEHSDESRPIPYEATVEFQMPAVPVDS